MTRPLQYAALGFDPDVSDPPFLKPAVEELAKSVMEAGDSALLSAIPGARAVHERAAQGELLFHPARERLRVVVLEAVEADELRVASPYPFDLAVAARERRGAQGSSVASRGGGPALSSMKTCAPRSKSARPRRLSARGEGPILTMGFSA